MVLAGVLLSCLHMRSNFWAHSFSVPLLSILVLAVCLFVGGFFWQKFKVHATGLDLIIFWSFWRSLPGLVWDGMKFVFHLCTFCCRKQGYSQSVSFLNITITE